MKAVADSFSALFETVTVVIHNTLVPKSSQSTLTFGSAAMWYIYSEQKSQHGFRQDINPGRQVFPTARNFPSPILCV